MHTDQRSVTPSSAMSPAQAGVSVVFGHFKTFVNDAQVARDFLAALPIGLHTAAFERITSVDSGEAEKDKYQDKDALGEGLGMDVGVQNEPGPSTAVLGMYEDMMKGFSALEQECNRMASKGSDAP